MARRKRLNKEERKNRRNKLLAGTVLGAGLIGGGVAIAKSGRKANSTPLSNIKSTGAPGANRPNPPGQKAPQPRLQGHKEFYGPPMTKKMAKRADTINRRKRGLDRFRPAQKNRMSNRFGYDLDDQRFRPGTSRSSRRKGIRELKSLGRFSSFMGSALFA